VAAAAAASRPPRPTGSSRAILAAGSVTGALLVGVGLWVMTPGGAPTPLAAVPASGSGPTVTLVGLGPTVVAAEPARATLLGDGEMALVTRRALLAQLGEGIDAVEGVDDSVSLMVSAGGRAIEAVLAPLLDGLTGDDGDGTDGPDELLHDEWAHLARVEELVLVVLDRDERPGTGYSVAATSPGPDDLVTVLTDPPLEVPFHEVDDLEVADGTAVVDGEGALVGICTWAVGPGDEPAMVLAEVTAGAGAAAGLSGPSSSVAATAPRRPPRRRLPRRSPRRGRRVPAPVDAWA
jgi:hypothetical protein